MQHRKLRMGMIGGGRGSLIGAVHRMAAQLDGRIELVCGAFSAAPALSKATGHDLFLPPDRVYASYDELFKREAVLPDEERMDFVSIVTPNHLHLPVAMQALDYGFAVMCDKPLTLNLQEAKTLAAKVEQCGLLFGLTHNYTGYPMVKEARAQVASGRLGKIRKVVVEYPQGWLATAIEADGHKQAGWRTDPARSGICGCMADIGTHAENLAAYITGLRMESLCADLASVVEGRVLDDDGAVLVRYEGGARGILYASQISAGEENPFSIRVYGEKGGLAWRQEEPNTLTLLWPDRPREKMRTGGPGTSPAAKAHTRLPAGHPEGFIEAFANLYRNFALTLRSRLCGAAPRPEWLDFPTVSDGVRGMAFLETLVRSRRDNRMWTPMET